MDTSITEEDTSITEEDTSIQHISDEFVFTNIELDWEKVDGTAKNYGSALAWKKEWSGFPEDFYPILENFSHNLDVPVNDTAHTVKQLRNDAKKKQRKGRGKKLRK